MKFRKKKEKKHTAPEEDEKIPATGLVASLIWFASKHTVKFIIIVLMLALIGGFYFTCDLTISNNKGKMIIEKIEKKSIDPKDLR